MSEEYWQLIAAWDAVDGAINRVATAQPFQMTEACAALAEAQNSFRETYRQHVRQKKDPRP